MPGHAPFGTPPPETLDPLTPPRPQEINRVPARRSCFVSCSSVALSKAGARPGASGRGNLSIRSDLDTGGGAGRGGVYGSSLVSGSNRFEA